MNDLVKIEASDELIHALDYAVQLMQIARRQREAHPFNEELTAELQLLRAALQTNRAYRRARAARSSTQAS